MKQWFGLSVSINLPRHFSLIMSLILLLFLIGGYLFMSHARHVENPDDKVVPNVSQLMQGVERAISPDRNGDIPLLIDTMASLRRLALGVLLGAVVSILLGLHIGVFPILEAIFLRPLLFLGKIPPLAILPILFIFAGLGESAKIILIAIGIAPSIALDTYFTIKKIPQEQIVKALTLGASPFGVAYKIILPQAMPQALTSVRINLLSAWLFLIAAETIAADTGLGYRIFLVRRYMAMDTIIPYVLWIAALAFLIDALIAWWVKHRYSWYGK